VCGGVAFAARLGPLRGRDQPPLDGVFFLMADSEPLEMGGHLPLPEGQLDRFLFKILVPFAAVGGEWNDHRPHDCGRDGRRRRIWSRRERVWRLGGEPENPNRRHGPAFMRSSCLMRTPPAIKKDRPGTRVRGYCADTAAPLGSARD